MDDNGNYVLNILNVTSSGHISCFAQCNPPCTYRWTKEEEAINTTDGVLQLASLEKGSKYIYRCTGFGGSGKNNSLDIVINIDGMLHINSFLMIS